MMRMPGLLALLFCATAVAADASSSTPELGDADFQSLSTSDDIPNQNVTAFEQDADGFLWVGTPNGLFRFEGDDYRNVDTLHTGRALGSAFVRVLLATPDGVLWIGTDSDGLFRYDTAGGEMRQYRHDASRPDSLGNDSITALALGADGALWIGTRDGLDQLRTGETAFRHVDVAVGQRRLGNDRRVLALCVDRHGALWVGTWDGLLRRGEGGAMEALASVDGSAALLEGRTVLSLLEAADGALWVGTSRDGAFVVDAATQHVDAVAIDPAHVDRRGDPMVLAIAQPKPEEVWLGGHGGVVVVSAKDRRTLHFFQHDVSIPTSLAHSQVRAMRVDRAGAVWLGGYDGGVQRYDPARVALRVLHHSPARPGSLSSPNVGAVLELADGSLWVGTRDNGVDILDRAGTRVASLRIGDGGAGGLTSNAITSLAQDRAGRVWVGTQSGLRRFDPVTRRPLPFAGYPELEKAMVRRLTLASDGRLWIGSNVGVARWQASDDSVRPIAAIGGHVVYGDINAIVEEADGRIWIGCGAVGLYSMSAADAQLQRVPMLDAEGREQQLSIVGMLISRAGELWLDTAIGLFRARERSTRAVLLEAVGARLGLPALPIGANLQEDAHGRLWTQRWRFDPVRNEAVELTRADGADIGTPWFRSTAAMRDGRLLFGGSNGLLVLDPERFEPDLRAPPLRLAGARIDGKAVPGVHPRATLTVPKQARSFALEFAALDFAAAHRVRYEFRLDPFDEDWRPAGEQAFADFTNIPPGDFVLRVRALTRSGVAASNELAVPVMVEAHLWQTRWFRWSLLAALAALLLGLHRARIAALRHSAAELERMVALRTAELSQAKAAAEEALVELRRTQRQLVEAEKLAALGGLVAGVAHELNTPIGIGVTAVSHLDGLVAGLERGLSAATPSAEQLGAFAREAREATALIARNLERSDRLVRHFKQVAVDRGGEEPVDLRLDRFLEDVIAAQRPELAKTPHRIQLDCPGDVALTTYPIALAQVLGDLIGNALQHAFDGGRAGQIAISARREPADPATATSADGVLIVVRDDGRGMNPEVLAHVFEPFVTTRRGKGGTGLGLHILYNLVIQVLGGRIRAESAAGQGTRFEIRLPRRPT